MLSSEYWRAIFLGAIQGVTEFLPISSKGHLVLCGQLLDRAFGKPPSEESDLPLIIALHFGTLVSIVYVYGRELWRLPARPKLCLWIILATIPAGLAGILLKDAIEASFENALVVAVGLCVTAAFLFFSQRYHRDERSLDDMRLRDALTIGVFQSFALIPGISRSGSTIAGGLLSGLSREAAARFSFFIAIPIIAAASLLKLGEFVVPVLRGAPLSTGTPALGPVVVGTLISCLVGILSLRALLAVLHKPRLHWFALYCLLVAAIIVGTHVLTGPPVPAAAS